MLTISILCKEKFKQEPRKEKLTVQFPSLTLDLTSAVAMYWTLPDILGQDSGYKILGVAFFTCIRLR